MTSQAFRGSYRKLGSAKLLAALLATTGLLNYHFRLHQVCTRNLVLPTALRFVGFSTPNSTFALAYSTLILMLLPSPWININRRRPYVLTLYPRGPEGLLFPKTFILTGSFAPVRVQPPRKFELTLTTSRERVGKVAWEVGGIVFAARVWIRFKNSLAQLSGATLYLPRRSLWPSARITCHDDIYVSRAWQNWNIAFLFGSCSCEIYSRARESSCSCVCAKYFSFLDATQTFLNPDVSTNFQYLYHCVTKFIFQFILLTRLI